VSIKLSIITIVYNGSTKIERTIQSVLNQDYKNVEYIIIDGGSIDGTVELIKKYDKYINFWISEKDNGISDAFNKGLKIASGDFIGLINCGDVYENGIFTLICKYIINHRVDCENPIKIIHGNIKMGLSNGKVYRPLNLNTFNYQMPLWHPTIFLNTETYRKYNYNTEYKIAMDYELFTRLYILNPNILYINQTIVTMDLDGISNFSAIKGFKEVMIASRKNLKTSLISGYCYYFYRSILYKLIIIKKCLA